MKKLAVLLGAIIVAAPAIAAVNTAVHGAIAGLEANNLVLGIMLSVSMTAMLGWLVCLGRGKWDAAAFLAFFAFAAALIAAIGASILAVNIAVPSIYRLIAILAFLATVVAALASAGACAKEKRGVIVTVAMYYEFMIGALWVFPPLG